MPVGFSPVVNRQRACALVAFLLSFSLLLYVSFHSYRPLLIATTPHAIPNPSRRTRRPFGPANIWAGTESRPTMERSGIVGWGVVSAQYFNHATLENPANCHFEPQNILKNSRII